MRYAGRDGGSTEVGVEEVVGRSGWGRWRGGPWVLGWKQGRRRNLEQDRGGRGLEKEEGRVGPIARRMAEVCRAGGCTDGSSRGKPQTGEAEEAGEGEECSTRPAVRWRWRGRTEVDLGDRGKRYGRSRPRLSSTRCRYSRADMSAGRSRRLWADHTPFPILVLILVLILSTHPILPPSRPLLEFALPATHFPPASPARLIPQTPPQSPSCPSCHSYLYLFRPMLRSR